MKVNTRIRYGLRMVTGIAIHGGIVNAATLGAEMRVSAKYLRKLAGPLEKAGIIASEKGLYGGYTLGKPAQAITLEMIMGAYNERIVGAACLNGKSCELQSECLMRPVWQKLQQKIDGFFSATTIADIIGNSKESS